MFLNFNFYILLVFNFFIILNIYYYYFQVINISINYYDIYSRIYLNDIYINWFYYWWTTFWYIPIFILVILYIRFNMYMLKFSLIGFIFSYILVYQFLELQVYWTLNIKLNIPLLYLENINNLLTNSINKYHPLLLYWGGLFLILVSIYWFYKLLWANNLFYLNKIILCINAKYIHYFIILFFTLGLGGWWALQEGSWGGWWNWDASEVFGLLILLILLFNLHIFNHKSYIIIWFWLINFYVFIIFILYYFIQFNFNLISHNFDLQSNNIINTFNQYLLFFLILSSIVFFYFFKNILSLINWTFLSIFITFNDIIILKNKRIWFLFLILVLFYEIIYSLLPLWNDFLWKLLMINISNQVILFHTYNIQLCIFIFIFLWSFSYVYYTILLINYFSYFNYLILFTYTLRNYIIYFHQFILLFIWLSLLSYTYLYHYWVLNTSLLDKVYMFKSYTFNLNNIIIEYLVYFLQSDFIFYFWNIIKNDTVSELVSFSYIWSNLNLIQILTLGNSYFSFYIYIYDCITYSFIYINIFLVYYLYSYMFRKINIKF